MTLKKALLDYQVSTYMLQAYRATMVNDRSIKLAASDREKKKIFCIVAVICISYAFLVYALGIDSSGHFDPSHKLAVIAFFAVGIIALFISGIIRPGHDDKDLIENAIKLEKMLAIQNKIGEYSPEALKGIAEAHLRTRAKEADAVRTTHGMTMITRECEREFEALHELCDIFALTAGDWNHYYNLARQVREELEKKIAERDARVAAEEKKKEEPVTAETEAVYAKA